MGWTLWSLNRKEEALTALDRAIMEGADHRREIEIQVVAQLIEDHAVDQALEALSRWEPDATLLDIAGVLVEKGRLQAAKPLLLMAWEEDKTSVQTGLYLAYVQALSGNRRDLPAYLAPFLETLTDQTPPHQVHMALEAVLSYAETLTSADLVFELDDKLGIPYHQDPRLIEILEMAAARMQSRLHPETASELYRRVLERSPDRPSWLAAFELDLRLNGEESAEQLLKNVQNRATSIVVRAATKGKIAERRGHYEKAIAHYRESLAADPEQPRLNQFLFDDYLQVGRVDEAREVAEWTELKISEGNNSLRSYAAEMWMALDEPDRALEWWQMLHLSLPDIPYYAVEEAAANYAICETDEAIPILEEQIETMPTAQAYELLAEIQLSLGQYAEAAQTARDGLADTPSPGLHRTYAENAEMAGLVTTDSLASARALLESDPGHVQGTLLAARQLQSLGMTNETVTFLEDMLDRNPNAFTARVTLKNIASAQRHFRQALTIAQDLIADRPWDVETRLRYAIALSEAERVHASLQVLRRVARRNPPRDMVPVLLYRFVTECPYPGRNTFEQLGDHLRRLQSEGYQLVTPEQIRYPLTNRQAIVILEDANQTVLEATDMLLKETGGRAVYAGNQGLLTRRIPGKPSPAYLKELAASGRWLVASGGPEHRRRQKISKNGLLGNPFTHPVFKTHRMESKRNFASRLNKTFKQAGASVADAPERILVYPSGDYGQVSLDTRQDDNNGFLSPGFDPLRIPARVVPATWNGDRLAEYLQRENPAVQSQMELAKLLYWNRQHAEADYWFKRALASGADPETILFNWGANAYQQGDLPTALRCLRAAQTLNPTSDKIAQTLENALNRKRIDPGAGYRYWEDNEDRSYQQFYAQAHGFVRDYLQLGALIDHNRWKTEGLGEEQGLRLGLSTRWFLHPQIWLDAQIWQLQMDSDLSDLTGGKASLRLPTRWLGGFAELQASRQEIETVEALREEIHSDIYELVTYSRLLDKIDVFANGRLTDRTDDNRTWLLYGRIVYRLKEWPHLGAGYLFRFGDSDFNPDEYWAPEQLEQHQLYATARGIWHRLGYSIAGQVGVSRERERDWQFIWGGNGKLDWRLTRRLSLMVEGKYQESETYNRTTLRAGATLRF